MSSTTKTATKVGRKHAQDTPFSGRIAHGMLTASVISAAVANKLPGPGAVYVNQSLNFRAPVRPGDTVHATVTVKEIVREKRRVVLDTICKVRGQVVIDGEALVKVAAGTASERRDFSGSGAVLN